MERKVIKFNLVGAIGIVILIVAIIIGVIMFMAKGKNRNDNDDTNGNNLIQYNDGKIDETKEIKEKITIQGSEQEIVMKTCKGSFGYSMKYDTGSFYVEKHVNGIDEFKSLYTNTVNITVYKKNGDYEKDMEELKAEYEKLKNSENGENFVDELEIKEKSINGAKVIVKHEKLSDKRLDTYYIKNDDGYFVVEANCGLQFENMVGPIIEKMVESFEVL
nr:hypothetical protein [Clostridia bacterium]